MGTTAAKMTRQRVIDLLFGGLGIFVKERLSRHQHAVDAIAALHGLRVDESLLQTVWLLGGTQALKRGDGT